MTKLSPKQEAQICHTITVLMSLLADYTDEIKGFEPISNQFRERAEELLPICEELLTKVYGFPEISSSTYLTDLSNKIDSIIRHNYERII
jgi:hypothetical protein